MLSKDDVLVFLYERRDRKVSIIEICDYVENSDIRQVGRFIENIVYTEHLISPVIEREDIINNTLRQRIKNIEIYYQITDNGVNYLDRKGLIK